MGARKRTWTPAVVRDRIRAAMIVNRLEGHIVGRIEMSQSQVTAALGLLRKVVPDLKSVEHSGHVSQTVEHVAVSETDRRISELLAAGEDQDSAPALPH